MSLVGTRPPTVDEWELYEPHHRARMSFRPGLTGMWQVSGRSNITDFEEVVKLDTQYITIRPEGTVTVNSAIRNEKSIFYTSGSNKLTQIEISPSKEEFSLDIPTELGSFKLMMKKYYTTMNDYYDVFIKEYRLEQIGATLVSDPMKYN